MADHDITYYLKCLLGGALACGVTHTAVVPLDIVKCRVQVDPKEYPSLGAGMKKTLANQGAKGLTIVTHQHYLPFAYSLLLGMAPNFHWLQLPRNGQVRLLRNFQGCLRCHRW